MNTPIQTSLTTLETALQTLLDSISSYNPSLPAAQDLLTADDVLTHNLDLLSTHQANHTRILSLRTTATNLSTSLTSTLSLLASTRTEILSTPATPPSRNTRQVPYAELMNYARNIGHYTPPPTSAPAPDPEPEPEPSTQPSDPSQPPAQLSNGTRSLSQDPISTNPALQTLTSPEKQWLDPLTLGPYTPWPSEETIRGGALAQIQAMLERGEDPAEFRGEQTTGEEGDGEREGEKMEGVMVENGDGDGKGEDVRRASTALPTMGRPREREEKPVMFSGLDLYDPDED